MTTVSYSPTSYEMGGALPQFATHNLPAPVEVGGASLGDDSDASYVTLRAHYESMDPDAAGEDSDLASCYFPPVAASDTPLWWHVAFRAKNNTQGYSTGTDSGVRWISRADDPDRTYIQQAGSLSPAIAAYTVPAPTWFAWAFTASDLILPGAPGYDTNWSSVDDYTGFYDALTTSGLQVSFTTTSTADTRYDWLDLFEVRLVVAFGSVGRTFNPVLRVLPRSDGRGASSAARVWPRPPTGNYGRIGPGSLV